MSLVKFVAATEVTYITWVDLTLQCTVADNIIIVVATPLIYRLGVTVQLELMVVSPSNRKSIEAQSYINLQRN